MRVYNPRSASRVRGRSVQGRDYVAPAGHGGYYPNHPVTRQPLYQQRQVQYQQQHIQQQQHVQQQRQVQQRNVQPHLPTTSILRTDMGFLIRLIVNAIALIAVTYVIPGIHVSGIVGALIAALILGIVNAILRPILIIISLPLEIITLGLFTFVINGLLFWLVGGASRRPVRRRLLAGVLGRDRHGDRLLGALAAHPGTEQPQRR